MNNIFSHNVYYRRCLVVLFGILLSILVRQVGKRVPVRNVPDIVYGCILGYYLAGLSTAGAHWFLDTYDTQLFKEGHAVFKKHHENPLSMEENSWFITGTDIILTAMLFWMVAYGGLVYFRVTNAVVWSTLFASVLIVLPTQVIHRWSHRRKHNIRVPPAVKQLQDMGVILHPSMHSQHHAKETVHYGIVHSNVDMLFQFIMFTVLRLRTSAHLDKNKNKRRGPPVTIVQVANELKPLLLASILFLVLKKIGA
jgi:hypothetical protein